MAIEKIFPVVLIVLDLAAAVVYGVISADFRMVVYWTAAAVLTVSVTF